MDRTIKQLFLFSVSGLIGFLVDALVLSFLLDLTGHYVARIFSFIFAVIATWLINRNITFNKKTSGYSLGREFLLYFCLMILGGALNYMAYAILVYRYAVVHTHPVIGVAVGSLVGMFINFITSKTILYRLCCANDGDYTNRNSIVGSAIK